MKSLSGYYAYRIKANPEWGLETDIIMCAVLDAGKLVRLEHCTEEDAKNNADFIMAAEANTWKRILRKLDKFVGAFMGQRIKLEKGNTVKALGLAPHANTLVDSLTQVELKFPDELSPEELSEFKNKFAAYRADKGL
ncbi:MAG: hypothetical protein JRL30_08980 [Deltaproteobacteria bacterium]|nr:hypothetical protein [Deltaproteobacteria bacterium]